MKEIIQNKLLETEKNENVRILLAVESGSRAWGFASPDSDYDVRFIYIRPKEFYLKLEKTRDVLEYPINDLLDINGWDLNKTLRLLHGSNPTLFEWFSSPTIYLDTDFRKRFKPLMDSCFISKKSLHHYLSMAEGHYKAYIRGYKVKAKKYFYVLRPLLACRWILDKGTPPPMLFKELMDSELSDNLKPFVEKLLDIKMNSPEIKEIYKIQEINNYIDQSITEIKEKIALLPAEKNSDWDRLNEFFLEELENNHD